MTLPTRERVLRGFHRPALWLVLWAGLFALIATGSLWPAKPKYPDLRSLPG